MPGRTRVALARLSATSDGNVVILCNAVIFTAVCYVLNFIYCLKFPGSQGSDAEKKNLPCMFVTETLLANVDCCSVCLHLQDSVHCLD